MPLDRDKDNYGLEAFRQALARQEGSFMRAATFNMNDKKLSDGDQLAKALLDRNAKGQFMKKDEGGG